MEQSREERVRKIYRIRSVLLPLPRAKLIIVQDSFFCPCTCHRPTHTHTIIIITYLTRNLCACIHYTRYTHVTHVHDNHNDDSMRASSRRWFTLAQLIHSVPSLVRLGYVTLDYLIKFNLRLGHYKWFIIAFIYLYFLLVLCANRLG